MGADHCLPVCNAAQHGSATMSICAGPVLAPEVMAPDTFKVNYGEKNR